MNSPDNENYDCQKCGETFWITKYGEHRDKNYCPDCLEELKDIKGDMKFQERRDGER